MPKLSDKEIAAAHLALDNCAMFYDGDVEREQAEKERFFNLLEEWLAIEHEGDCIKQPIACRRCIAEEAYSMVQVYRQLFRLE